MDFRESDSDTGLDWPVSIAVATGLLGYPVATVGGTGQDPVVESLARLGGKCAAVVLRYGDGPTSYLTISTTRRDLADGIFDLRIRACMAERILDVRNRLDPNLPPRAVSELAASLRTTPAVSAALHVNGIAIGGLQLTMGPFCAYGVELETVNIALAGLAPDICNQQIDW